MANWCSNSVVFEGSQEALAEVKQLFHALDKKEAETQQGQLPDFVEAEEGYMFSIYWGEGVDNVCYETKWSPNIEVLQKIAEHFKLSFEYTYDELGNLVYGQVTYKDGVLTDIWLEPSDFDLYDMSGEDDALWLFEGKEYESDYEILEILLERKKEQLQLSNN